MTATLTQLLDDFCIQNEDSGSAKKCSRPAIGLWNEVETPAVAAQDVAARVVTFQTPRTDISQRIERRIDWYAKNRRLPPLIADFIDTHWRSYALRCFLIEGEDSEVFREAIEAMKDLAWSVRLKKDPLSRRRLVELIPRLYQRLHVGLEFLELGVGTLEHDAFFADLVGLHKDALNPSTS